MLANNILLLIADTVLSVYTFILLLRGIFMLSNLSFYHPLAQAVVRLSEHPIQMLRPIAPCLGRVDTACWLLCILVKLVHIVVLIYLQGGAVPNVITLLPMVLLQLANIIIYIYIFAIIILAVSSWFMSTGPSIQHPFISAVYTVTSPLLNTIRRWLPNTGMIDFSPVAALLFLYIVQMVLQSLRW